MLTYAERFTGVSVGAGVPCTATDVGSDRHPKRERASVLDARFACGARLCASLVGTGPLVHVKMYFEPSCICLTCIRTG